MWRQRVGRSYPLEEQQGGGIWRKCMGNCGGNVGDLHWVVESRCRTWLGKGSVTLTWFRPRIEVRRFSICKGVF